MAPLSMPSKIFCWVVPTLLVTLVGCYPRAVPPTVLSEAAHPPQDLSTSNSEENASTSIGLEANLEENSPLEGAALSNPQETVLAAQDPDAQINVRASPSADAESIGAGFVGNGVKVLRIATANDGYDWYYIRPTNGDVSGWVRADFVKAINPTVDAVVTRAGEEDVLSIALDTYCGGPNSISAYYGTDNFIVYICTPHSSPIYLSNEIGTPQVLITEEVQVLPSPSGGYVARQDNYEYHVSESELAVYRIDDQGRSTPILQEKVTTAQHY